jgi:nicotinamide-nucleotide amidase
MFAEALLSEARDLLAAARQANVRIVTAESCTGGLIAALLTEIPGSSDVVERGFVTYSNQSKQDLLGVPEELLRAHGAVSEPVCRAMAQGALKNTQAQFSMAVTGVAGPGGGSPDKPVGLVYIAAASQAGNVIVREYRFGDVGRSNVRMQTVEKAIALLRGCL